MNKFRLSLSALALFLFLRIDEIIVVDRNGTTIKVNTDEKPVDPTARRNIAYTTEMAITAVNANISDLKDEKKEVESDVKAHAAASNQYALDKATVEKDDAAYLQKVDNHNWGVSQYKKKVAEHNQEVDANNALPAEKRDQSNVNRLNQQKAKLDEWNNAIDDSKKKLDNENQQILSRYDALELTYNRLKTENDDLSKRYNNIMAKLGLAYKQLKQLSVYAGQINTLNKSLNGPSNSAISGTIMKGANEALKEKSNLDFDGNKTKAALTNAKPPLIVKPN